MKNSLPFIRENRTYCGTEFMTVNLFQYTEEQQSACRKKRKRREKLTPPKQMNLNDRNQKRYFTELVNANFTEEDIVIHPTYDPKFMPKIEEEDIRNVENFLRRVNYARKKAGLPPMKRIWIPEGGTISKRTGKKTKYHHHIIMSGGLDRDLVESLWKTGKGKKAVSLGFANADRLKPGENGLEILTKYLSKAPRGSRRWRPSKNLTKPERTTNDHKYSNRKLRKLCESGEVYDRTYWEKKYPSFTLAGAAETAIEADAPDEMNGNWRVYAKLRKIVPINRKSGTKSRETRTKMKIALQETG
ncbi:MAG: hypothetical protein LUE11_04850 [Clostridia bacterium]|nr:hypothetical protein [Clostridia bacterium]